MNPLLEITETISTHLFLELQPEEKSRLALRIKKWNGLVRIFIHPLYEKWSAGPKGYPSNYDASRVIEIEQGLARLLSLPEEKTPPIIIFEENWALKSFYKWQRKLQGELPLNPTYIINTCQSSPTPYSTDWYKAKGWQDVKAGLSELGVKKILIGGIKLDVSHTRKDWTGKGSFLSRCVGIALSHLPKDKAGIFETELSALIAPRDARSVYLKHSSACTTQGFHHCSFDD